jgi:hypothetical protein
MSLAAMRDPNAIRQAMSECDRIGRDTFLERHGYGKRTRYALAYQGRLYDPKAILGVAHGIEFPQEGDLPWNSFNGGAQTNDKLHELGFEVIRE